MLSESTITELREIIREEYGKEVPLADVREIGENIVRYFDLLAKIYHRTLSDNGEVCTEKLPDENYKQQ